MGSALDLNHLTSLPHNERPFMIPVARLGFAIRKLLFSTAGLEVPESVPSLEVAIEFSSGLAAVDVAMCGRADVQALLAYAATTSPDAETQELIGRLTADIDLPSVS